MHDERWRRLWDLFHEAAGRPAGERAAFLENAARDDAELRAEVEELLAAASGPGLISAPRLASAAGDFGEGETVGERVGPYRLVRQIGEGGMGVVFEAEQEEPIRRRVALKLVKVGMDTREVLTRFEAERQALALMDHPNIARVFDAGASARGRPYFVMELVEGVRITDYCDAKGLSLDRRLALYLPICRAVEHAHRKAILHRDLKPSNILVSEVDGAATPKVIDFGLAKAIAERPGEQTRTRLGGVLGTPDYMSPEQALGAADVDTRADVYSLGVILFELLAGRLPADPQTPGATAPRPSAAVSRMGAAADEVAARRGTDAHALRRRLRGEVDWIVQKALEPERSRRYGSASELGGDLERHLHHEPVTAAPPSKVYRASRFARRHRAPVAAAASLVVLLATFAVYSAIQAAKLRAALGQSREVTRFLLDIFQVSDPDKARGREISAREILDRGAERVASELRGEPQVQATLMQAIGVVYRQLGLYDRAEELIAQALAQRRRLAGRRAAADAAVVESLRELGRTQLARGEYGRAQETLVEAVEAARRGAPRSQGLASALVYLASARRFTADLPRAEEALDEAMAIQRAEGVDDLALARTLAALATVQHGRGAYDGAEASYREAIELRRRGAGADDPEISGLSLNLGAVLYERGDVVAAEALQREALNLQKRVLGAEHPSVALTLNNLALLLQERGVYGEAEVLYREALALNTKAYGADHPLVASNKNNLGWLYFEAGDFERAAPFFAESLAMQERSFGPAHPNLGFPLNNLARLEHERGALDVAEPLYRRGLEIRRAGLPAGHPDLAGSLTGLGSLLVDRGDAIGGEALLREGLAIRRQKLKPGDWRTAETESYLGRCLTIQGRLAEAEPLLRGALAVLVARRGAADRRTLRTETWLHELASARARAAATPVPPSTSG